MTAHGQAPAFAAVYERHRHALYRYCRSIVRHEQDAQDALQSTMTRAFAALQDDPREHDMRPWLFRIAHNEAVSILRRRRPLVELDAGMAAAGAVHERFEASETLRLLRQDLGDLPERQRAALVLRELSGLAPAEIAELLDTTPGAVKQAIFEARRALSKCDEGRATSCFEVQRALSDGDGRVLRGRGLRAHLRSCASCRRFSADLARRPADLAAVGPAALASAGSGAAVSGVVGSGVAASGASGILAGSGLLAKAVLVAVVATGAAAGAHALGGRQAEVRPAAPPALAPPPVAVRAARPAVDRGAGTAPAHIRAAAGGGRSATRHTGAPATAPRRRNRTTARHVASVPPGQPMKQSGVSPGQAKKQAGVSPGQAMKQTGVSPGQAKKQTRVSSGQAKKQTRVSPRQAVTRTSVPPGQAKKDAATAVPPRQAKPAPQPVAAPTVAAATPAPTVVSVAPGHSADAPGHDKP